MLKIAVDYDNTFTANPVLVRRLIRVMAASEDVRIVTYRHSIFQGNDELIEIAKSLGIEVIFCGGMQKKAVCTILGWIPDIWIDDRPESIPTRAELSHACTTAMMNEKYLHEATHLHNKVK